MCVTQMFRFGSRKGSRKGLLGSDPPDHSYLAHACTLGTDLQTAERERDVWACYLYTIVNTGAGGDTITSYGRRVRSLNVNF